MKKHIFKVSDKVFAKVKGYPPWPAQIISENGKRYNVKFYGTGETGVIKVEDLFYYLKNKEKFHKPLKRKDYVDAVEQIEEAIKKEGGDGDLDSNNDESILNNTNNASLSSDNSVNMPPKETKKAVKRKASLSEKSLKGNASPIPSKRTARNTKSVDVETASLKPTANEVELEKDEPSEPKEIEFVQLPNITEMGEEQKVRVEKNEDLDFKIEIISERLLSNNIAYAKFIRERPALYKAKPVEPREDYISQVLPVKLPSGQMGGIKLHLEWPLKFKNEYERALYDESVATRVLQDKRKLAQGPGDIANDSKKFVNSIEMTSDDVKEKLYKKDIDLKKARIDRLKMEADLLGLDSKIKNCLGLDKADPKKAIEYLDAMWEIDFDALILKKHPHPVEMVRRLRKYVGNTKDWKMSEEALQDFQAQAQKIRTKADFVYNKFKSVINVGEDSTNFWESFSQVVEKFRENCKHMTETQVYLLCAEPTSRRAFFDHLDEMDFGKENSSEVANLDNETAPTKSTETIVTES